MGLGLQLLKHDLARAAPIPDVYRMLMNSVNYSQYVNAAAVSVRRK